MLTSLSGEYLGQIQQSWIERLGPARHEPQSPVIYVTDQEVSRLQMLQADVRLMVTTKPATAELTSDARHPI